MDLRCRRSAAEQVLVHGAVARFGRLDILFNNAGLALGRYVFDESNEEDEAASGVERSRQRVRRRRLVGAAVVLLLAAVLVLFLPKIAKMGFVSRWKVGRWLKDHTACPRSASQAWFLISISWALRGLAVDVVDAKFRTLDVGHDRDVAPFRGGDVPDAADQVGQLDRVEPPELGGYAPTS